MLELINLGNKKQKQNQHIYLYHDPLNVMSIHFCIGIPFALKRANDFLCYISFLPSTEENFVVSPEGELTQYAWMAMLPQGWFFFFFLNKRWKTASTHVNKKVLHHSQSGQHFLLLIYLQLLLNLRNCLIHKYCIFIDQGRREYRNTRWIIQE